MFSIRASRVTDREPFQLADPPASSTLARLFLSLVVSVTLTSCLHDPPAGPRGPTVGAGSTVTIHYTASLPDGTVVATTTGEGPFSYVHGEGEILPTIEKALNGLGPGETTRVHIGADETAGPYNRAKVARLPRDHFPSDIMVGDVVEDQIGRRMKVLETGDETVVVDWNDPLAGHALIVDIVVLDVRTGQRPDDHAGPR